MNIGYIFLITIASMAYWVSDIPTPEDLIANFVAAQKFYTSGAYDQALEAYDEVNQVESIYLDEDAVVVEFGDIQIPVKDATLYKSGSTYLKMIMDENTKADNAESDEEIEKYRQMSLEYANKATEFFELTQERTKNEDLKAQSQNQIISVWYAVNDFDRVISEGEKLIENYPESFYVLDAMYNIGWAYFDKEDYDSSIQTLTELVTRFPTAGYMSERALFQIGESYFEQGKYEEAIQYYQQLVDKMRINELTDQEIQKIQRDKLSGLTDETALDLAAKSQLKVGACYASIGDYQSAETAYKRIAQLFRFDTNLISEAYQRLADMFLDMGNIESSVKAYRDAIDDVPDKIFSAKMQWLICTRYYDNELFEQAINEYNNYIDAYSDVAFRAGYNLDEAFFQLARSYYELASQMYSRNEEEIGKENLELSLSTYARIFKDFPDTNLKERIYFYQALTYQKNGSDEYLTNALRIYNLLLEGYPQSPYKEYTYFFIARAHQSLGDYDSAIAFYKRIIEENPETDQLDAAWMEMAVAYNSSNRESESIEYFLNVSKKDPKLFTTARLLVAQYFLGQSNYSEVVDVVSVAVEDPEAIETEQRLSQLYIIRGNAYRNLENYDESIVDYTKAYDLNVPETREMASVYRAGVYIEQGQLARAETDLKELLLSTDENVSRNARIRLAIISVRQEKSEQAIQTYLDLYNSTEDAVQKLGFLRNLIQLSSQSNDIERIETFATMMLNSDDAEGIKVEDQEFYYKEEAYFNLALAFEKQSDHIKARDYLIEGFEKFPNSYFSSDMLIKLGIYYLTALVAEPNSIDIAADYFDQYVKTFPNTTYTEMATYYLGLCYYNGRRFDEAYTTFSQFTKKYPSSEFNAESIFYYSDSSYNLGNLEECIISFDLVVTRYPKNEKAQEALYTKAWALMDLEQQEESIVALQKLVDDYPESQYAPHSMYSIADYYYNEQRYEEAMEYYQRVSDDYSDSEVAEKIPETISELRETIAYIDYEKAYEIFDNAKTMNDMNLYRQAAELFSAVATEFPLTESEIGAYSNLGICYEELEMWQNAADAYDMVIMRYEEGASVGDDAHKFALMHKQYIVANKF